MTSYLVRRPFKANGREFVTGDVFVGDAVHLRKLIEQRYLTDNPAEVPASAPVLESTPSAEPVKRGPGRPRKE